MITSSSNFQGPRQCGECEVCCFVSEVKEGIVNKPACQKCPFQKKGCSIFNDPSRPQVCHNFQCAWLRGMGEETDRPDKNGVMVSINKMNGGTWIMVMDLKEDAHKSTGKNIIIQMIDRFNMPVIVAKHDNLEKSKGDLVILPSRLLKRAQAIAGEKIGQLTNDINIYKLIIS